MDRNLYMGFIMVRTYDVNAHAVELKLNVSTELQLSISTKFIQTQSAQSDIFPRMSKASHVYLMSAKCSLSNHQQMFSVSNPLRATQGRSKIHYSCCCSDRRAASVF